MSSPRLYGGTYNLFHYSLPKLGIEVSFVEDPDDLDSWQAAVRPNTKAFFAETISNPQIDILDTPGVSGVAHDNGVPLIVDNTVATPYLIQPISQGADIVVHSATKYLGGHGAAIAGVIVDGGTFDWTQGRFPGFTTPDPSYHGVVFAELGPPAFAIKARVQLLRDYGSAASPFNAFLVAQGLETLSLRVERHVANAQRVAEYLAGHDDVLSVNYAGLPGSPWYELAKKLAPKGTGAVLSFELAGGVDAGKAFVNALKLHSHVANIGDVRSLVIHPASTTHAQLSPEEQLSTGVTPGLVRLAVGIEGIDDILADLELGFAAAREIRRRRNRQRRSARRGGVLRRPQVTISDVPTQTLPAEGEVGIVDIGSLTLESGVVIDDVSIAVQRWGELAPDPRQRRRGVARADRRLTHHRACRARASDAGLVGRHRRAGRADRHQPLVRGGHQCAGRLSRLDRAELDGIGRKAVGLKISTDIGAGSGRGRRGRAGRAGHHRRRCGARRVDGWSAGAGMDDQPPRSGRAQVCCWRWVRVPPPTRSAPSAPRSRPSKPTRTGRAVTITAPDVPPTPAWRSPAASRI